MCMRARERERVYLGRRPLAVSESADMCRYVQPYNICACAPDTYRMLYIFVYGYTYRHMSTHLLTAI